MISFKHYLISTDEDMTVGFMEVPQQFEDELEPADLLTLLKGIFVVRAAEEWDAVYNPVLLKVDGKIGYVEDDDEAEYMRPAAEGEKPDNEFWRLSGLEDARYEHESYWR